MAATEAILFNTSTFPVLTTSGVLQSLLPPYLQVVCVRDWLAIYCWVFKKNSYRFLDHTYPLFLGIHIIIYVPRQHVASITNRELISSKSVNSPIIWLLLPRLSNQYNKDCSSSSEIEILGFTLSTKTMTVVLSIQPRWMGSSQM